MARVVSLGLTLVALIALIYAWYEIPSLVRGTFLSDLRLLVWAVISFAVLSLAHKFE